jgi:hypothetical protein
MSNQQSVVLFLGLSLWLAENWRSGVIEKAIEIVNKPDAKQPEKGTFAIAGGELVLIAILTILAMSNESSLPILLFLFGLWLVWILNHSKLVTDWINSIGKKRGNIA